MGGLPSNSLRQDSCNIVSFLMAMLKWQRTEKGHWSRATEVLPTILLVNMKVDPSHHACQEHSPSYTLIMSW